MLYCKWGYEYEFLCCSKAQEGDMWGLLLLSVESSRLFWTLLIVPLLYYLNSVKDCSWLWKLLFLLFLLLCYMCVMCCYLFAICAAAIELWKILIVWRKIFVEYYFDAIFCYTSQVICWIVPIFVITIVITIVIIMIVMNCCYCYVIICFYTYVLLSSPRYYYYVMVHCC